MTLKSGLTVAICCHNSRKRILETLRHLAEQKAPSDTSWEVLLIDNASTDETAVVAKTFWDKNGNAPLRIIREETPGLSHARERAFREAQSEIISFIDDDNWVYVDWVARVVGFFRQHPEVGAVGARGHEVTEGEFPPWFAAIRRAYACGEQYESEMDVTDLDTSLLWGAGISMRLDIYYQLKKAHFVFMCSGRIGNSLAAGEDVELCHAIRLLGWRLYYDPALEYRHFIPTERLTWSYARKLFAGSGRGSVLINILRTSTRNNRRYHQMECYWWFQMARIIKNCLLFLLKHPGAVLRTAEGNVNGLILDSFLAQILQILSVRKRYRSLYNECRERFPVMKS